MGSYCLLSACDDGWSPASPFPLIVLSSRDNPGTLLPSQNFENSGVQGSEHTMHWTLCTSVCADPNVEHTLYVVGKAIEDHGFKEAKKFLLQSPSIHLLLCILTECAGHCINPGLLAAAP